MKRATRERLATLLLLLAVLLSIAGPWLFIPGAMLATYAVALDR